MLALMQGNTAAVVLATAGGRGGAGSVRCDHHRLDRLNSWQRFRYATESTGPRDGKLGG